jgi:multiple antibiotic resistance protein
VTYRRSYTAGTCEGAITQSEICGGNTAQAEQWCRGVGHAIIVIMVSFNLADVLVTFLALLGPQKALLSFARIARTLDTHSLRLVAVDTAVAAACVGAVCALTAPWLATFFHISPPALELAASVVFFVYAIGLVLGIHLDQADHAPGAGAAGAADNEVPDDDADPRHPLASGFRAMLLPFVVSPLAVAAALQDSLAASSWGGRWTVAGAFALVALFDAGCAIVFAPLLSRLHESVLEVLSRLLGILLAAVGVQLFLDGLEALGALHGSH